jgi:hypothetical protein
VTAHGAWRVARGACVLGALLTIGVAGPAQAQQPLDQPERRAQLEERFRRQLAQMLKNRLNLSDEQLRRLGEVNQRHEEQRRLLVQQERDVRMALREEMLAGERANQQRVSELLDRMIRIQRQRIDIVEREQRELSEFLTPMQRAQYAAVQEQLRRRIEEMRRQRQQQRRPGGRRPRGPGF